MSTVDNIKEQLNRLQSEQKDGGLRNIRQNALNAFDKLGIPGVRHEEWKYTRISALFNKDYQFLLAPTTVTVADIDAIRLPGFEQAHELVFINGIYSPALSNIRSNEDLVIIPLDEAANNEYAGIVAENLGHSSRYAKDGINALNTAWMYGGVFINVKKSRIAANQVYIYNVTDARQGNILSQPRSLV
mgnify:CR=1 FL=1